MTDTRTRAKVFLSPTLAKVSCKHVTTRRSHHCGDAVARDSEPHTARAGGSFSPQPSHGQGKPAQVDGAGGPASKTPSISVIGYNSGHAHSHALDEQNPAASSSLQGSPGHVLSPEPHLLWEGMGCR